MMINSQALVIRRGRQVLVVVTSIVAAASIGTTAATTADAKPKKQGPGAAQYWNCVVSEEDSQTGGHRADISWEARGLIYENCCTDLGGIYNEQTLDCYLPNGDIARANDAPPAPPQPGASVIAPPPGATSITG